MAALHIGQRAALRRVNQQNLRAGVRPAALRLIALIAATAGTFLLSAWAAELLWALLGAGLVMTLGEG